MVTNIVAGMNVSILVNSDHNFFFFYYKNNQHLIIYLRKLNLVIYLPEYSSFYLCCIIPFSQESFMVPPDI